MKNSSPHYLYDFVKANYPEMCFLYNHLSEIEKMEEIWRTIKDSILNAFQIVIPENQ